MKIKTIIIILFLSFIIPFVSAAPPVTSIQNINNGLEISYPNVYFLKQNSDLSIRFWVFNVTNGNLLTNATVNCTYNLINMSGGNVIRKSTDGNGILFGVPNNELACQNCFNLMIKGGNLTNIGVYGYQIRCQYLIDKSGGFLTGLYEVTSSGVELTEGGSLASAIIIIFFISSSFLLFGFGFVFEKNKWIIKSSFYIFALLSLLLAAGSTRLLSEKTELSSIAEMGYMLIIPVISFFILYVFILWTIETFQALKNKRGVRWEY